LTSTYTATWTGSFRIGNAFGIPIRLHWTFLALFLFVALQVQAPLAPLIYLTVLFLCVLLHELGHSLVARTFGIRVVDITFWPLGGMARLTSIPEVPRIEALVSIAGPAVNFLLAGLGLVAVVWSLPWNAGLAQSATDLAGTFVDINLMLGLFNLVPAFPMDGGRILRAWFARRSDWMSATERAVRVGRVIAGAVIAFFLLWLVSPIVAGWLGPVRGALGLPLIALFVWISGGQELLAVRLRHARGTHGSDFDLGRPRDPLGRARAADSSVASEPAAQPVSAPEAEGIRRPAAWDREDLRDAWRSTSGFDEQRVRELERFQGRLRPPSPDAAGDPDAPVS
jgi:stage IV sporulation protein FB